MKPNHKKAAKYYREKLNLACDRVIALGEERSGLLKKCEILQEECEKWKKKYIEAMQERLTEYEKISVLMKERDKNGT